MKSGGGGWGFMITVQHAIFAVLVLIFRSQEIQIHVRL